jgi:hypothetical protein
MDPRNQTPISFMPRRIDRAKNDMDSRRARFDLVLVGYRTADTQAALRFCAKVFGTDLVRRRVLVLNRPDLTSELDLDRSTWEIVLGTNTHGEFSGWQEGLARLGEPERGVIFMNDTVTTHRRFTHARAAALLGTLRSLDGPALVGFLDRGKGVYDYRIAGVRFDCWASTYCFALSRSALGLLENKLFEPDFVDRVVPGGLDESTFFSELSPDMERVLRFVLFEGGWYRAQRLTPENTAQLRLKGRCIVAELFLSARCSQIGIDLRDPFSTYRLYRRLDNVRGHARRALGNLERLARARDVLRLGNTP